MTDTAMTTAVNNLPSDLNQLTVEIKFHLAQRNLHLQQSCIHHIEAGRRLIQAKAQVAHGEWYDWLEDNFHLSEKMANNLMRVAERFGNRNSSSDLKLNQSQLVAMLALPEGEEEKFIAEQAANGNPVEDMTVKQLRAEVAEYKAQLEQKNSEVKELREDKEGLNQTISNAKNTISNLTAEKNQLEQDNAVLTKQRDDAAEDSAKYQAKNSELELKLQNQTEKIIEKVVEPADYKPLQNQLAEKQAQIAKLEQELATKDTTIEIQQTAELEQAKKDYAALEEKLAEYSQLAVIVQTFESISKQIDSIHFAGNLGKALAYYEKNSSNDYRRFLANVEDFYNLVKE